MYQFSFTPYEFDMSHQEFTTKMLFCTKQLKWSCRFLRLSSSNNTSNGQELSNYKYHYENSDYNYLKGECNVFFIFFIMDENDALSEYNKIPLGHNRTNGAVYS